MTDKGFLLTRQGRDRSTKVNAKVLSTLPAQSWKLRRVNGGGSSTTTGGGGGGGGCCCPEGDCLKPIPGIGEVPTPFLRIPATVIPCSCTGLEDLAYLKLYRVDPESDAVWETKHGEDDEDVLMCRYPDCTATTQWKWLSGAWVEQSTTGGECGTPLEPDYDGEEEGQDAETDFQPALQIAWWRITKTGLVGGCDASTLEFFIGDEEEE